MPRRKHGFTIIEVSLVLAIAGLILVMAFVALPALQRQSRDAKRKEDTALFLQALKKYQQNNRGSLPKEENWSDFYDKYLGEDFLNPDGKSYTFKILQKSPWEITKQAIEETDFASRQFDLYIFLSATCKNGEPTASNNSRNLAIVTKLETGASCADM